MELFLATKTGFVVAAGEGAVWQIEHKGLNGRVVTSAIAREGVILAGTRDGIYRSADLGRTWEETSRGLTQRHVRWLAFHPDVSDREFAGTEPAAIFLSQDGGDAWQERPEVNAMREKYGWWLPYSPEAGCVRGFAFHGQRGYAAVEVGAALRSDDGGATWRLAGGSDGQPRFGRPGDGRVHPDVHSIVVHPSSPDLVLAPTGGGFYRSQDGGATWQALYGDCYARAVWVDPDDAQRMVLGPAQNASGRDGRIEITEDGGQTWRPLTERWAGNLVERFTQVGDTLLAVLANGELLQANREELAWRPLLAEIEGVNALTTMHA